MEVLLRWHRPNVGVVMPAEFAALLDDTGLIVRLGEWVLLRACRQIKAWNDAGAEGLRACVNVSPRQFESPQFVASIHRALLDNGLSGDQLELEIRESVLLRDDQRVREAFNALKVLGVRIAFDDFGNGYASLGCLSSYPLDALKIGRSFVSELQASGARARVASAILSVGQSFGLKVVAVGVEQRDQLEYLTRQGCHALQGFLIAKPMSARKTTAWLHALWGRAGTTARRGPSRDADGAADEADTSGSGLGRLAAPAGFGIEFPAASR